MTAKFDALKIQHASELNQLKVNAAEELLKMKENSDEYNKLYQDIISVGEYPL
jgi:hypothetical protein